MVFVTVLSRFFVTASFVRGHWPDHAWTIAGHSEDQKWLPAAPISASASRVPRSRMLPAAAGSTGRDLVALSDRRVRRRHEGPEQRKAKHMIILEFGRCRAC